MRESLHDTAARGAVTSISERYASIKFKTTIIKNV